ncbi:hypothetical protein KIN20_034333 [Parelaphostrongylus tenuis]|uniref:Uncharacterized protein n=1 Tax=Parelaphostrongylus tenuis TaxID=148309 RepID=A0AAD5R9G4_PARTN|nr:hypothetical protein KIN20_034333 [Parelaphostrongylus tenuis]
MVETKEEYRERETVIVDENALKEIMQRMKETRKHAIQSKNVTHEIAEDRASAEPRLITDFSCNKSFKYETRGLENTKILKQLYSH